MSAPTPTTAAEVLAAHQPTGGASGVEGGWNRDCSCGAQAETLWDRDGDNWDLPFAAHQADALREAGLLVETTTEWGVRWPWQVGIEANASEGSARWRAAGNAHGRPGIVVRREVTEWTEVQA
jgi:hypothetical protein